ncbi:MULTISPECIES: DUF2946 family protein [unclassified Bradyrhizobium]|uniref:DUF2946 family protein n=1 Tax=unclassified Bradyrhizobium TaxID=2631580 RepID=UPI002FF13C27
MKWFRNNVRTGARLALFALVVQFALSFGHCHGAAAQNIQIGLSDAGLAYAADHAALDAASDTFQQQSSNHDNDRHPVDACAICAVVSLANNFLFATPPLLELPQAVELLRLTTGAEFAHLGSLHAAFQSRAPPVS